MVEVLERSMVVPSKETPSHSPWLSNLDLYVPRVYIPTVYFYRPTGDSDFFSVEPLKAALAEALVPFYPLAGRLGVDGAGRVQIECAGEGVLFVVARSELTINDFGDFSPSDETRRMLVPAAESADPPCIFLMFQVTFFKCGGVSLGAATHHTAADGLGFLHFINSWSDIARGAVAQVAVPPSLDRTLLRARTPPTVVFDHPEYSPDPPATTAGTKPSPFIAANLSLSVDQIKQLKNSNRNKPISTFKAVAAHVWRSACKARSLHPNDATRLQMTADARSRTQPPLPAGFLGNAVFRLSAVAAAGDISSNTLEYAADKIGEAAARLGDEYVRSLIDYLETLGDPRGLHLGKKVTPRSDVVVISWLELPIYGADFGWGRPAFMGKASEGYAGVVHVMPDGGESGGITISMGLESENMEEFKRVFYEDLGVCS